MAEVERLELARGLLRRAEARVAAPEPGGVLPVVAPLARLLPAGGLRQGSAVAVPEASAATSLLFALLAPVSESGAWSAVVGRADLGLVAAAEAGVDLRRLALVPEPGKDLVAVTIALLDGMDVVAVAGVARLRAVDRQRLAAKARHRGAVLVALGPWPGADTVLTCTDSQWHGLGPGSGRLVAHRVQVEVSGRGIAPGRCADLLLPARDGGVAGRDRAPVVRVAG